ncbi:hypothetical protein FNP_0722 [Fusobacterium polymorphum ATCC 10953]|uniref:Uncharacterized protein n=1 Tax=Fusobacterium polymorphum ATCC 10953 TaxID=393480 RepID=A5TUF0_FUSNP|nr:hypothetical protein FNP_0722 [Fusobacterium polymorphum ATCC 10953]
MSNALKKFFFYITLNSFKYVIIKKIKRKKGV